MFLSCQTELETETTPRKPKFNPYCKYFYIIGFTLNYCYSSNKTVPRVGTVIYPETFFFSDFFLRAASYKFFSISGTEDT